MIKVIVRFGAGNQLFQYAVGRTLAHIHSTSLCFDITSYGRYYRNQVILPYFNYFGNISPESFLDSATTIEIGRKLGKGTLVDAKIRLERQNMSPSSYRPTEDTIFNNSSFILSFPPFILS